MAQIDWNVFLPQEPGKALVWSAICLTALVGAGWGLFSFGYTRGKDIGPDELSAYKAASEAKLPEITSGLLAVNKELRESLKVFDRNKMLEAKKLDINGIVIIPIGITNPSGGAEANQFSFELAYDSGTEERGNQQNVNEGIVFSKTYPPDTKWAVVESCKELSFK